MKKVDLLNGPITASLARLAFPIIGHLLYTNGVQSN